MTQPQVDARVHPPTPPPPPRQCELHIARTVEVVAYPRGVEGPRIRNEIVAFAPLYANRLKRRLRREHAALHRSMTALDARQTHKARAATDQRTAGEGQPRYGLQTAFGDRTRAITATFAANENITYHKIIHKALELLKGMQRWVRIIVMDHIAHRHAMIFLVIEKTAAARAVVEWPTERMQYLACAVARGVDAPQLFAADTAH